MAKPGPTKRITEMVIPALRKRSTPLMSDGGRTEKISKLLLLMVEIFLSCCWCSADSLHSSSAFRLLLAPRETKVGNVGGSNRHSHGVVVVQMVWLQYLYIYIILCRTDSYVCILTYSLACRTYWRSCQVCHVGLEIPITHIFWCFRNVSKQLLGFVLFDLLFHSSIVYLQGNCATGQKW